MAGVIVHGPKGSESPARPGLPAERAGAATGPARPPGLRGPRPPGVAGASASPGPGRGDAVTLFTATREALTEECSDGSAGKRFVLVADDLDGLDESSASLVGQLLEAGALFLVATVVAAGSEVRRVLAPGQRRRPARGTAGLDEGQVAEVMRQALGGPVEPRTASLMHRVSGGNPRYLREFVAGAGSGEPVHDGEAWTLVADVASAPLLAELLERRLAGVGPETRRTLNRIALCQPVEAAGLSGAAMDELETSFHRDA